MRSDASVARRGRGVPLGPVVLAGLAPALARLRPSRLAGVLTLATRTPARPRVPADAVARVERALGIVGRVRSQTCLTRGITRFVLLRRAGMPVELVFGVCATAGSEGGHCWLEVEGQPYLETTDPRTAFPEVFRIPARTVAA